VRDNRAAAGYHQQQSKGDAKLKPGNVQECCECQHREFIPMYEQNMTECDVCDA
jgi:hypothetical protein